MRVAAVFGMLFALVVAESRAQTPLAAADGVAENSTEMTAAPLDGDWFTEETPSAGRYWTRVEYLLWWRKPICPKPAVMTTGSPNDAVPGALGQPNTQTVLGGIRDQFPGSSGVRPTVGMNLTDDGFASAEVSGFWLQPVYSRQSFVSGADGSPNSYLPFTDINNQQQAIPFTIPGVVSGRGDVVGESFLWGLDSTVALRTTTERRSVVLSNAFLVGARYLDLTQSLTLTNRQQLVADPSATAMGSAAFDMRNQFAGPQIGWLAGVNRSYFTLEAIGKIAMGWCHQTNNVQGGPLLSSTSGSPLLLPGPLLVEPSNVLKRTSDRPALSPQIDLRLRIELLENLTMTLGYSLLYLNKVLCPGDQMSASLNPTQLPGRGPVTGPLAPTPIYAETDFFAQGLNVGLEYRF